MNRKNTRFVRWLVFTLAVAFCCGSALAADGKQTGKTSVNVKFTRAENYFVKNTVKPPKGQDWTTGIAKTQEEFDAVFGPARVMGPQKFLPEDVFDTKAIVYFIQWGNTPWEFKVRSLVKENGILRITYQRTGTPSPSAQFAVPLMLCVDKEVVADNPKVEVKLEKADKKRKR